MKILFKIISAFLYFNSVSPVQMYYIYDETPNVGFVSVDNGIGTYMKTGYSVGKASKKQFTAAYSNPKFQKINNEHVVDSHFKVRKTPYALAALPETGRVVTYETNEGKNKAQRIVDEYRKTEAPLQQNTQHQQAVNTVISGQQDNQNKQSDYSPKPNEAPSHIQPSNNQQIPPIRPKAVNADYSNSMRQRNQDTGSNQRNQVAERAPRNQDSGRVQVNQDLGRNQVNQDLGRNQRHKDAGRSQMNQDGAFDSKPTYKNVRKAPMSPDSQLVLLNNNHQMTSLSVISPDKRQRTAMIMDKTLHKTSGIANEHNKQVMSRVLDDMTKKIADRRPKKGEYVNMQEHLDTIYEKSKRSVITDNMRKYIGKDKITKDIHRQKTALARIGSHEDSLEDGTPYAVFYRMNPESLDRQDRFMITRAMDDSGTLEFSSKEKRSHSTFQEDTESMTGIQHSRKTGGGGTFNRRKLKNFSSYTK